MSELPGTVKPRDCPYVGLDFYQEKFGAWFFGREAERDKIITNLQAARLTLLHAESGVGKSSLLRAGVAWQLRRQITRQGTLQGAAVDIPVVFSSWQDAPVLKLIGAIREAIEPLVTGHSEPELPTHRLDAAIETAANAADAGLLVILDQFEEYFLYRSREPVPEQFADELARCVNRADLPANFLIAIREDAYAGLGDLFKGRIANVYGNYLHIDYLDRASAEKAIRQPLAVYNSQPGITERVEIQDELVEAVLDQVRAHDLSDLIQGEATAADGGGRVATPLLQLVMETIWQRDRAAGSRELRLATLQNLQGVEKIVDTHLWKALRALGGRERQTAIDVFDHLVTPSGGKIAEPVPDLARRTGHSEEQVGSVLEKLDHARVVRPLPAPPGQDPQRFRRYEIFHDVLTPAINRTIAVREERRRARRFRRLTALAVSLLIVTTAVGGGIFYLYRTAITQKQAADSGQLAAAADANLARDPELSVRLALQALRLRYTSAAEAALRDALPKLQAVRTFQDGTLVFSAAFDPVDPNKVASADKDGAAWIWDVRTERRLVRLAPVGAPGNAGTADTVAYNPAGTKVAVGYANGTVALFDAASGKERQPITVGPVVTITVGPVVKGVQFVGSTGELAIATQRGVGLWLPEYGSRCCDILSRTEQANSIAVDPGNPLEFAVATDNGTVIWTLRSDLSSAQHRSLDTRSDNDAEFNPDGREVVTAATDGKVRVYDLATFQEKMTLDAGEANVLNAAFSPDETRIVAAYSSGTARVWDASSGLPLALLVGHASSARSARFNADSNEVVTAGDDGTIRVWQAQPRELRTAFPSSFSGGSPNLPNPVYAAKYSPEGGRILTVDSSGAAYVFTAGGEPVYSHGLPVLIYPGAKVNSARFNRAGTEIVTADSNGTVDLWNAGGPDYAQIRLPVPIHLNGPADYADFGPDGSQMVIVTSDHEVEVRSTRTGQLLRTLNPQHGFPLSVAVFSPNGRQILTGDGNGQVEIWDAATGREIRVLDTPGPVSDVEFNSRGSEFVTTSDSGAVTIWSARDDRPLNGPFNACPTPSTASFSPDGSKLVVACGNGNVPLFDAVTGQQLTALPATSAGTANSAEFSPDGKSIVTAIGGEDSGDVRVWNTELATASLQALELEAAGSAVKPGFASTASPEAAILNGTWTGSYDCPQGTTGLSLVIHAIPGGTLTAAFNFYAVPHHPSIQGSFTMTGTYSAAGVDLSRSQWISISQPFEYIMVDLSAGLPAKGGTVLSGHVATPGLNVCTTFAVTKSASSGSG
jgi:WD40 repeat protein